MKCEIKLGRPGFWIDCPGNAEVVYGRTCDACDVTKRRHACATCYASFVPGSTRHFCADCGAVDQLRVSEAIALAGVA